MKKPAKKAMGGMMPIKPKKSPMAMPMMPKGKTAMPAFKKGGKAKGC
jgi:hypothetical protein